MSFLGKLRPEHLSDVLTFHTAAARMEKSGLSPADPPSASVLLSAGRSACWGWSGPSSLKAPGSPQLGGGWLSPASGTGPGQSQLRPSHDSNQGIVTEGSLTVILSAREKPSSLLAGLSQSSCRLSHWTCLPACGGAAGVPLHLCLQRGLPPAHRHLLPEWTIMDFGNELNLEDECIHAPIKGS